MDAASVEEIEEWASEPFSGGHDGLHELAGEEFTGAVAAAAAHLFMLNGRVVGVADGTIETFEGSDGTAYRAPHPSLPLLFAMQEQGGETRGQYYTEDTPIEEVDETLSQGGFTGYLELSENVLSGDYYVVYHGGRSMSVAFVGQARRVLTGEEAFEKASDEVGIYEATSVDLDVVEIPGEPPEEADEESTLGAVAVDEGGAGDTSDEVAEADGEDAETATVTDTAGADAEGGEEGAAEPGSDDDPEDPSSPAGAESGPVADDGITAEEPGNDEPATGDSTDDEPATAEPADESVTTGADEATVRTVPSVDPDRSGVAGDAEGESDDGLADSARLAELKSELTERERELAAIRERVEEVTAERDDLESEAADLREELESVRAERDELRQEVTELREDVERLRERVPDADAGPSLAVAEARSGTNLFVRYDTKSEPTLDDAREGGVAAEDLRENLDLEYHTQFDENATVEGRPFEDFLTETAEYRFLRWLVTDLFFEIRTTGNTEGMGELYDAIPDVDRVELDGAVSIETDEGEEVQGFDLVARDRMGQPLVVADIDESREPLTEDEMVGLVEGAEAVCAAEESLAAAFSVAASFFDPDALEAAREATSGSLLSRDKRKSFVKLSRKRGFHLCLVEDRDGTFHLSVPDL